MPPCKAAEIALEKVTSVTKLSHVLLTLDVMFLDEAEQVSSDFLITIDIILRKGRCSQIPFSGVMIIGTINPCQLQPTNALPFLASSFMLTYVVMVGLKHSVRAHSHPEFKRLQDITRMDPYELRASQELRDEFFKLAKKLLVFVSSWNDKIIGPNMMRAFLNLLQPEKLWMSFART